ncbi:MAG: YdcF family protein [Clostridia bacterium]|nr:YdcF family protein [Clostridia bacterium]
MDFIKDTTEYIFISSPPRPSDVIFLPGGSDPSLPEKAAELYRAGYAPYLVASGKFGKELGRFKPVKFKSEVYAGDYKTEAEFYRDVLTRNGVPDDAVICEEEAEYTHQNAEFSAALLKKLGVRVRSAILVCKAFHARRAYTYYQNAFPDAEISVTPVAGFGISAENWYKTELGRKRVAGELKRLGEQFESLAAKDELRIQN